MSVASPAAETQGAQVVGSPPPNLWRHRNFRLFWAGQSVSLLGSTITFVALPLVGVLLLQIDTFKIGLIATVSTLPSVAISPFLGSIVDWMDRRRLMILADVVRAALIASIPIAAAAGMLTYGHLLVVGAGLGMLTLLFSVAHQASLPRVVPARSLADANGKLEASQSVAEVSGPGVAGWLVGAVGPAGALIVDAVSYVVSALCLHRLRVNDTRTTLVRHERLVSRLWADTKAGARVLWRDPVLRSVNISYAVLALFAQVQTAVYMVFLVRSMGFSPLLVGIVFSISSLAGIPTALASGRLAGRLGLGRLIVIGQVATVIGGILLAAIAGPTVQAAATMLLAEAFFAAGMSLYGVGSRTLIQVRTSDDTRGSVIGASRVLVGVLVSAAGVIGGGVGAAVGLRAAMIVGAVGMVAALVLVLRPRVWAASVPDAEGYSP